MAVFAALIRGGVRWTELDGLEIGSKIGEWDKTIARGHNGSNERESVCVWGNLGKMDALIVLFEAWGLTSKSGMNWGARENLVYEVVHLFQNPGPKDVPTYSWAKSRNENRSKSRRREERDFKRHCWPRLRLPLTFRVAGLMCARKLKELWGKMAKICWRI